MGDPYKTALWFLNLLYSDVPEGSSILLWRLTSKQSFWYSSIDAAAHGVKLMDSDIYVGSCLGPKGLGSGKRTNEKIVTHMPGVWVDVDFAHQVHKKPNLPPNRQEALALIHQMPLKPTLVIDTGHGLHSWWLFRELVELSKSRDHAIRLLYGWNRMIIDKANDKGWTVDNVGDLARIMRIPGTWNAKDQERILVKVLEKNENFRYDFDDLDNYIPTDIKIENKDLPKATFHLNENAQPPREIGLALHEHDDFYLTWKKQRKDLQDQSQSGYDLSLATYCMSFGWSDQKIVDTLVAHRRLNNEPQKLRVDYYVRTLERARKSKLVQIAKAERESGEREIDDEAKDFVEEIKSKKNGHNKDLDENDEDFEDEKTDEERKEALSKISKLLGFEVLKIERLCGDAGKSIYILYCDPSVAKDGRIILGYYRDIKNQEAFICTIEDACRKVTLKRRKKWAEIWPPIFKIARIDIDIGETSTLFGMSTTYVREYIKENAPINIEKINLENVITLHPIKIENKIHIFQSDFTKWIQATQQRNITPKRCGEMLRMISGKDRVRSRQLSGHGGRARPETFEIDEKWEELLMFNEFNKQS